MSIYAKVVAVAISAFVMFFGVSNWYRQVNLQTSQFDMGNMDQVMWHTLHGQWFTMTDPLNPRQELRSAVHADYLLLAYVPFYAIWSDPRTLLVLQVVFVASGAIPLFLSARRQISGLASAMVAMLYVLYPTLQWAVTFDVHAVVLAAPLFLWAWWAAEIHRLRMAFIFVFLAILSKEEVGLVAAGLGVYWLFKRPTRWLGILSVIVGLGWSAAMVTWIIPQARQAPGHFAIEYFSEFGSTPLSIITNIILHPWRLASQVFDQAGVFMLRALWLPVGFLPIFGLPIFLIALPEVVLNLASSNHNLQSIFFQYMSAITPFVFLSTVVGWRRIHRWIRQRQPGLTPVQVDRWMIVVVGAMAAVSLWRWAPLPGLHHHQDALRVFQTSPYRDDVKVVKAMLAPNDRVVATNNIVPQFSGRQYIWAFPRAIDQADAIIVLLNGDYEVLPAEEIRAKTVALLRDPAYELVYSHDDFFFFRPATLIPTNEITRL